MITNNDDSEVTERRPPQYWDSVAWHGRKMRSVWRYGGLLVMSTLSDLSAPDGSKDFLPTWVVSVSKNGKRPDDRDMDRVRKAFGMQDAEEDNHEPGIARKLMMCVDPARRVACECKTDERVVVEPDGYRWSASAKKEECGGCEMARLGLSGPCSVHAGARP